ncbi:hypothetical protein [Elizabethkingia anophelis]|uniref:hypothetical protein n=1 Tax=Elizabethkingia anophelis TaxID=1117645 RepID=UPI0038922209
MSKREYVALHNVSEKKILLKYDYFGVIQEVKLTGERWSEEEAKYAVRNMVPYNEIDVSTIAKDKQLPFEYQEIPDDLSFKNFWNTYGYKVGKIAMAQKAWNSLSDEEKVECLLFVPKFKMSKMVDKTAMPYPSTFLNQRYWMAEKI